MPPTYQQFCWSAPWRVVLWSGCLAFLHAPLAGAGDSQLTFLILFNFLATFVEKRSLLKNGIGLCSTDQQLRPRPHLSSNPVHGHAVSCAKSWGGLLQHGVQFSENCLFDAARELLPWGTNLASDRACYNSPARGKRFLVCCFLPVGLQRIDEFLCKVVLTSDSAELLTR